MLSYDTARAALPRGARARRRAPSSSRSPAARSATPSSGPAEYAAVVLAAAIREEWEGPVFLQGDHFQTNPKKMKENPEKEIAAIEALIEEAIPAGFFQIDIDTSTLVDLSKPTLDEQQRRNVELAARFTKFIRCTRARRRCRSPSGGEIGEVGKENSTPEELRAYMDGYRQALGGGESGIAKVSVQTGSSHGGIVAARRHGPARRDRLRVTAGRSRRSPARSTAWPARSSTAPRRCRPEFFGHFPDHDCAEIHLATEFQNMVYEHPSLPLPLKREIERWLFENAADERKKGETEPQFLYKTRKKAIGPFKERLWNLPGGHTAAIRETLEKKFTFLFEKLRVAGHARARARDTSSRCPSTRRRRRGGRATGFVRDDQAGD